MDLIQKIRERAKATNKTIVLAEGIEERVIKAAVTIRDEKIAKVILLGREEKIKEMAGGIDLSGIEIIDPEIVGVPRNKIILSARSGRHALKHRLEELGYGLENGSLEALYGRFLQLADQKREVFDEDLHALMGSARSDTNGILIKNISVTTTGVSSATATVTLELHGEEVTDAACGNGPVDAVFKAIDRLVRTPVNLEDYTLSSVSRGSEALGSATVKVRCGEAGLVVGRGISTDVIEASARAYVNALAKAQAC